MREQVINTDLWLVRWDRYSELELVLLLAPTSERQPGRSHLYLVPSRQISMSNALHFALFAGK